MKEIKAIIRPYVLSKVVDSLRKIEELPGITVDTNLQGFGRNGADASKQRITLDNIQYARKARLEVVVPDSLAEQVVQTIIKHAHTGNPGDGKIQVNEVSEIYRIRTGEQGEEAL